MLWKGQVYLVLLKQIKTMMMISSSGVRGNWKLKLALDSRQPDNKEDNDSNVDAIERASLSSTIETDNKDNDE